MRANSQDFLAIQSIFGTGCVPDERSEQPNLPVEGEPWLADFVKSLGSLIWAESRQTEH